MFSSHNVLHRLYTLFARFFFSFFFSFFLSNTLWTDFKETVRLSEPLGEMITRCNRRKNVRNGGWFIGKKKCHGRRSSYIAYALYTYTRCRSYGFRNSSTSDPVLLTIRSSALRRLSPT